MDFFPRQWGTSGAKCWEVKSVLFDNFLEIGKTAQELSKNNFLDFWDLLGTQKTLFNWKIAKKLVFLLYSQRAKQGHFSKAMGYKVWASGIKKSPILDKISDFVKLLESSLEIHFGTPGTSWGLRNHFQSQKWPKIAKIAKNCIFVGFCRGVEDSEGDEMFFWTTN